ncbi:MAG: O-antigen ligase family protein [Actinomycetota bacterium]|nr:O-antigen ligase family protein [Actinomycetota bacterium]
MRLIATRAPTLLAGLLAAGAGAFGLVVAHKVGWLVVLLALVGLAVALLLLERPAFLVGGLIVLTVLVEGRDASPLFPDAAAIYEPAVGGVIPLELLSILMLMGVGLEVLRRRDLLLPEPLTVPLLVLVMAILFGLTMGYFDGAPVADMVAVLRKLLNLVILPLVIVNVVRTRAQLRTAVAIVCGLALVKALVGLSAVIGGFGFSAPEAGGGGTIILTYYESTANWVLALFVVGFVAALTTRARMPRWVWATAPLALASLLLSYRRSFWIGASVGLVLVVLLGSGRFGRRVVLPLIVVVGIGLALTLSGHVVTEQQSPLIKRAQSLDPTKLKTNKEDRYRIDERRNVLADIADHPITGMGIARGWEERYPVSVERKGSRDYVHFVALWYWLHLGILGLAAYLWLFGAAIAAGYGLWKRGREPWMQAIGLGFVGSLAALMIAETTASFTGIELRATIVVGAALGLLAAARRIAAKEAEAQGATAATTAAIE